MDSVFLGDLKVWRVRTADGALLRVSAVNSGNGSDDVKRGEHVRLAFAESDVRILPR